MVFLPKVPELLLSETCNNRQQMAISRPGKSCGSPDPIVFEKVRFKVFPVHTKTQSRRFRKERFRKAPFSWRITLGRRDKAVCAFKFLRRSVDEVWSKPGRQWAPPNKRFKEQNKGCTSVFSKPLCISWPSSAKQRKMTANANDESNC